jgi:hypothetical protein
MPYRSSLVSDRKVMAEQATRIDALMAANAALGERVAAMEAAARLIFEQGVGIRSDDPTIGLVSLRGIKALRTALTSPLDPPMGPPVTDPDRSPQNREAVGW